MAPGLRASAYPSSPEVARDLEGVDNQALGRYLKAKMRGGDTKLPPLGGHEATADELFGMWGFEAGHPRRRITGSDGTPNQYWTTFGHRRDWTYAMMTTDLLDGHTSIQDAILKHPAQGSGAQPGARLVTAVDVRHLQPEPTSGQDKVDYDKRVKKEIELVEAWVRAKCTGPSAELWATKPTTAQIEAWVEEQIKNFRGY